MTPYLPLNSALLVLTTAGMTASVTLAGALRELSTDRPDTTESPFTVDAGHFQFEMEIANWSRGGEDCGFSLGELNAKLGLTPCNDLQLVLPLYQHLRDADEGFGDMQIRLKHNLWGNDEGETALAVMPFIQLPTANGDVGSGRLEGGVIVPFAFSGPGDLAFGVQGEADLVTDEAGTCEVGFLASGTASHPLTETTSAFVELVGIVTTGAASDWEAYFNSGLTWSPTATWQLDGGIRVGLTDAAVDFSPFVGLSTKF